MQVTIRPLVEQDAYTSYMWRNDSEVFRYTANTYDHVITLESELCWIRRVISNTSDYRCAIIVDDVYVGNIYLTDIVRDKAAFHIFIGDKSYWGKGIAKQASKLIIDYGFSTLQLNTIYLEVNKENESAIRLYEKLGFKLEREDVYWLHMVLVRPNTSVS